MINFRVANLDRMIAQLQVKGIAVTLDPEIYPNGRFARLSDPGEIQLSFGKPPDACCGIETHAGSAERRATIKFRGTYWWGDSVEPLALSQPNQG